MRITNSKRWGRGRKKDSMNTNDGFKENTDSVDYTGCVRIFNGADGEWLAKVVDSSVSDVGGGKNKRRQQQRKKRRGDGDEESGAVLECIEQLLPQQSATKSDIYNVQLYIGHLKNKQRRKWVFEKATELAVDGICILDTDYTNQDQSSHYYWEDDRDKHRAHVIEAAEQCERLTIPSISSELWSMERLVDAIISSSSSSSSNTNNNNNNSNDNDNSNNTHHNHYWLVCRERSESSPPILSVLQGIFNCTNNSKNHDRTVETTTIHILIGPEGGWVSFRKKNMHLKYICILYMSFPHFLHYFLPLFVPFLAIQSPGELETFSKLVQSQQNENDNNQIVQVDEDEQTTEQDTSSSSSPSISDSLLLSSSPVQFVSLGSTTLRAETAAITAVVAVQMHRDTVKKL